MRSEAVIVALRDIAHHVDLANEFAEGLDFRRFCHDRKAVYAVIRCLEIISEASRRLPAAMKARHSSIHRKEMASAGNVYRHDYEDVAASYVWITLKDHLPPLQVVVQHELAARK